MHSISRTISEPQKDTFWFFDEKKNRDVFFFATFVLRKTGVHAGIAVLPTQ